MLQTAVAVVVTVCVLQHICVDLYRAGNNAPHNDVITILHVYI